MYWCSPQTPGTEPGVPSEMLTALVQHCPVKSVAMAYLPFAHILDYRNSF
jgi:hypothetical protein